MKEGHERSSGNVFADLGFPNSERQLIKAELTVRIYRMLKDSQAMWGHPLEPPVKNKISPAAKT